MKQVETPYETTDIEDLDISESGSWRPRPKTKKSTSTKFVSIVVVCIIVLGLLSYYVYSQTNFFSSIAPDNPSQQTEEEGMVEESQPIVVGEYSDSAELTALKEEAFTLFGEQIQAYFYQDPEVETKINEFEEKLNEIVQKTYDYYVAENNGGWSNAENSFIDFLQNLDYEGVRLKQSSVPYYLERLQALEGTNEE
ncbi:MAG: hypothetical protein PHI40_01795 [Caldisericia bacterium]|nr:hypothetical protein [Caldisericia bacterium]MDD4614127.1 hypothetical protein [Caldisericia bacterium]